MMPASSSRSHGGHHRYALGTFKLVSVAGRLGADSCCRNDGWTPQHAGGRGQLARLVSGCLVFGPGMEQYDPVHF